MRTAQRLGAGLFQNTRVVDARADRDGFVLETSTGDRLSCAKLVNTAGAWALEIARRFGESAQMFAAGPPQFVTEPLPYAILPSVQAVSGSVIFRQVARGNVVVAGYPARLRTRSWSGRRCPPGRCSTAMAHLARMAPMLRGAHVIRAWSGIEGYCRRHAAGDRNERDHAGLFHAFGFCGHGFQLGPGVGAVLSEMILDGATPTPLAPFSIGRFRRGVGGLGEDRA